jgi:glycosyltransferase involved in cell wall biosynthesis
MTASQPFFSICIPHYGNHGRTDFLLAAFESFAAQSFRDFEICVSDDASPDGRQAEIEATLKRLGLRHVVNMRSTNSRYDVNLRSAIGLASGRYCILMGNDDALRDGASFSRLAEVLGNGGQYGVLISDFEDYSSGVRGKRILVTRDFPGTPETAARRFRNLAFVSGIALEREAAQTLATDRWDGSEMYQMWIGCRMISTGHRLIELAEPIVRKDIAIGGSTRTGSYAWRPRVSPCPIVTRPLPFNDIGKVVCDAIAPVVVPPQRAKWVCFTVFYQLFTITYPYWLIEYRRVQSWNYAAGIALGMRPGRSMKGVVFGALRRGAISSLFLVSTFLGLLIPLGIFQKARPALYRFAKSGKLMDLL